MSKYEPLKSFLASARVGEVPMSFSEVERVIGKPLPPVARKHRAWWSNNPSNSVITHAWLDAGFKTERVDMASERLVFRRTKAPDLSAGPTSAVQRSGPGLLERIRARLGGTVTIMPGVDLTAPLWEEEGGEV
jgi:hypothetical protein